QDLRCGRSLAMRCGQLLPPPCGEGWGGGREVTRRRRRMRVTSRPPHYPSPQGGGEKERAMAAGMIDVHIHLIPQFYSDAVYEAGSGPAIGRYPDWTPALARELMDKH